MQDTMLPTDTEPASSPGGARQAQAVVHVQQLPGFGQQPRPAALRMASRPLRSNSSRPSSVSRERIWKLTAAWVRATCSAASEKEP